MEDNPYVMPEWIAQTQQRAKGADLSPETLKYYGIDLTERKVAKDRLADAPFAPFEPDDAPKSAPRPIDPPKRSNPMPKPKGDQMGLF